MKRMFICAGIALGMFSSCGNNSSAPNQAGETPNSVDTVRGLPGGGSNMNNDNTNNNKSVNTADSSMKKIISEDSTQRR